MSFTIIAAAIVASCSIAHAEQSKQSDAAVRIRWLPDCGPGSDRPYFSVEVRDDGLVCYEGQDGAKLIGMKESRIDAASARRLGAKVLSFARQRKVPKPSARQFEPGYFCLEASTLRGGEPVSTNARRSDARSSRALLQEVSKRIGPEKWACPASSISHGRLDASGYCTQAPAFTLTLGGRTACDVTQDLFVYDDGTVYSLAYRTHGRSDPRERYYEIAPGVVVDLVNSIRPFARAAMEITEDPPGRTQKIYYRDKPEDVDAIRARLASLVDMAWLTTDDAAGCEQFSGPKSAIHLREDLEPSPDHSGGG